MQPSAGTAAPQTPRTVSEPVLQTVANIPVKGQEADKPMFGEPAPIHQPTAPIKQNNVEAVQKTQLPKTPKSKGNGLIYFAAILVFIGLSYAAIVALK